MSFTINYFDCIIYYKAREKEKNEMKFIWLQFLYECLKFIFVMFTVFALSAAIAFILAIIFYKITKLIAKYKEKLMEIVVIAFIVLPVAAILFSTIFISIKGLIRSNGWQCGFFLLVLCVVMFFLWEFIHGCIKELYHNDNARSRSTKWRVFLKFAVYMLLATAPTYVVAYAVSVYYFCLPL